MSFTKKPKLVILKNEDPYDHLSWVKSCESIAEQINFSVVDITESNWLDQILLHNPDLCLLKPSGKTMLYRDLYEERIEILVKELGLSVFPSLGEVKIYENKRYFAYWAKANNIPHPKTYVIYNKKEAREFVRSVEYPLVGKMNIGASGNGILVIKDNINLSKYVEKAHNQGIASRTGPKLNKGNIVKRLWKKVLNPSEFINRLKTYKAIATDKQIGYVILQEFVPHQFEWRIVRIGDSFFAHKKIKIGDKASGSLKKEYGNPPLKLLSLVKEITDKFKFFSQAVDVFETNNGDFLINEMQCIFGQSDPHQMIIDGNPGRYYWDNTDWIFEEGDFNTNQSYDLRLKYILDILYHNNK